MAFKQANRASLEVSDSEEEGEEEMEPIPEGAVLIPCAIQEPGLS